MAQNHSLTLGLTALLLAAACSPAERHSNSTEKPIPEIEIQAPTQLSTVLIKSLTANPDRYKRNITQGFDRLQIDNEVRNAQIEDIMKQQLAAQRGQMIGAILAGDLDNDGELTANELLSLAIKPGVQIYFGRGRSGFNSGKLPVAQGDRNGDGIFSADEIRRFADLFVDMDTAINNNAVFSLMAFDSNRDGVLTRSELDIELASFNLAPAKSGLDSEQAKPVIANNRPKPDISERRKVQQRLRDEECEADLAIPVNAEIVLLSGYEGTALATATVTDQTRDTEVTQVIIEAGDRPLFIIAGTYTDMIWSLEGATDRVSGFVARKARHSAGPGAGVMGLPAQKVGFIPSACMRYFKTEKSQGGILAKSLFERIYDRPVETVVASYKLDSVMLPSGVMRGADRRMARLKAEKKNGAMRTQVTKDLSLSARDNYVVHQKTMLYRFFDDGIAYVDPDAVVSPSPLSEYEIYPDHAGIAQLIESGHLEQLERETYYIKKTFAYFPAGLGGAHSVKFILGKGVERPGGSPGHSALIEEATGRCTGARCPRE